jgi:hypothetical protein
MYIGVLEGIWGYTAYTQYAICIHGVYNAGLSIYWAPEMRFYMGPFDKTCITKPLATLAKQYIFLTISQIVICNIKFRSIKLLILVCSISLKLFGPRGYHPS